MTKGSSIESTKGSLGGSLCNISAVVGSILKNTVPVKANCFK